MKKLKRMLVNFGLFLSLLLLAGCGKDTDDPIVVGQPTVTSSFSIITTDAKSSTVSVRVEWKTENATKGTLDGLRIKTPSGDTTFTMKKGEKKNLLFTVENSNGKSFQSYLKIEIPSDPLPPTMTTSFTFNDQSVDTLPYLGGKVKVKVLFANGFLYLNGVKYEDSPKTFDFTVTETKTYDFKVVGPGGEISFPVTVPVYIPTEIESLFISETWVVSKLETTYFPSVGPWIPCYDYIGAKLTFYLSFPYVYKAKSESVCGDDVCISWSNWSYDELSSIFHFGQKNVISIDENEMIVIYESSSTSGISWFVRETYHKSSNP